MEDYIYILLGLVWIIYSVYRANQKKKKARENAVNTAPVPEVIESDQTFSSILDEFFDNKTPLEEEPSFSQPEPTGRIYESQHGFYDKNIKTDYKLDSIPAEEGEHVFNNTRIEEFFDRTSISEDYEEFSVRESLDFDLRKAVIYSEILNRPNF